MERDEQQAADSRLDPWESEAARDLTERWQERSGERYRSHDGVVAYSRHAYARHDGIVGLPFGLDTVKEYRRAMQAMPGHGYLVHKKPSDQATESRNNFLVVQEEPQPVAVEPVKLIGKNVLICNVVLSNTIKGECFWIKVSRFADGQLSGCIRNSLVWFSERQGFEMPFDPTEILRIENE